MLEVGDLRIDYAKQRVDDAVLAALIDVAEAAGVAARRDAMFGGVPINTTEHRAVLHVALRAPKGAVVTTGGHNVVPDVHAVLDRMGGFSERVRDGSWTGVTGRRIRTVVNIGIGGSDLGPAMATRALDAYPPSGDHHPLRLQRRRGRHRRRPRRPRPGGDAVHRLVEDVHHHRDAHQRPDGAVLADPRPR